MTQASGVQVTPVPCLAPAPPPLALLGLEPIRAAMEYVSTRLMDRRALPVGDGHPVILFPGLAAHRATVAPLKTCCEELGYAACDWGRGFNTGPRGDVEQWLDVLADEVGDLTRRHGRAASLIGWSLGGFYAREIARKRPRIVRQVITLGTPFAAAGEGTHVTWIYRLLSGQPSQLDRGFAQRLRETPPVPTTSIYSRTDGVIAWQACREVESARSQNIEVQASHCGLIWHPQVWAVVADRLASPEGRWRRYADAGAGVDGAGSGSASKRSNPQ
jgi:dienelactone hydrolase